MSQIFIVLPLAVFHTRLFLPLTTATIITSFLTRICTYTFFWHFTKKLVQNKHAVEKLLAKINWLQFGFVGIKNVEANVYEVVISQQLSFNCWGCRSLLRKSWFSGCINDLSQIIKRFCRNIWFNYLNEVLFCHLASSPKSYKYFSGHALQAADLHPVLLVTSHPVKICALSSTCNLSVSKISANW